MRRLVLLPLLLAFTGCGYVHFGRLPTAVAVSDNDLTRENTDLRTEKKILTQELDLARKEGDTLRKALENPANANAQAELVTKLRQTSDELTALRASYAKLEQERSRIASSGVSGDAAALQAKLSETEEKLAVSLRTYTDLQRDNNRLRTEIDQTRSANVLLTAQVRELTSRNAETQAALSQLNTELLAQRDARARAEAQAQAARAQLQTVVQNRPSSLADTRDTSAAGANAISAVSVANGPAAASATAELRTNPDRVQGQSAPAAPKPAGPKQRTHVVKAGESLDSIAKQYYGTPDRWTLIYRANNDLLSGGREPKVGMELVIPEP